jgi:hypothetical protein
MILCLTAGLLVTGDRVVAQRHPLEKAVGIALGDTLPGLADADVHRELGDLRRLGVTWVRVDLVWARVEATRGGYDWSEFDQIVLAANAARLRILVTVVTAPPWARRAECKEELWCAPREAPPFALFVARAVRRYSHLGVHFWEVWNEPNLQNFWKPAPDPVVYTRLLAAAQQEVQTYDPHGVVVSGGLGSISGRQDLDPLTFLRDVYQLGGRSYFDILGIHPYSFPVLASTYEPWSLWARLFSTPRSLSDVMNEYGDRGKEVWITEFGAPTEGPGARATAHDYNLRNHPDHVDEALQAAMVTDAIRVYRNTPRVTGFFWYSYRDLGTSRETNENFFGLLRADGSKKPAYWAFAHSLAAQG